MKNKQVVNVNCKWCGVQIQDRRDLTPEMKDHYRLRCDSCEDVRTELFREEAMNGNI